MRVRACVRARGDLVVTIAPYIPAGVSSTATHRALLFQQQLEMPEIVMTTLVTATMMEDVWYKYVVLKLDASEVREGEPSWLDFFRDRPPHFDSMLTEAEIDHLRRVCLACYSCQWPNHHVTC